MSELHLVVLWAFARSEESRIAADLAKEVVVLRSEELAWPSDALACYTRFYGANLADANAKVVKCGTGPFRLFIVRDETPVYGFRETSRGMERVNLRLFDLKTKYRAWTGGGHKVHTTNSAEEFARDILLLTGKTAEEWQDDISQSALSVLPGQTGWTSLREMFAFLDRAMPYAVLRNAELLPDAFDPSLHGDIDLLVPDATAAACALGARKVFPEDYRVHYEVIVAGRPVRLDLRYVGDDYYDRRWEEEMLNRRVAADGLYLLAPEDAFYSLVYHAVYQKYQIASDYPAKAAALARAAGLGGEDFDDWLILLEEFLSRRAFSKPRPKDVSVRWNPRTTEWRSLAEEISDLSGATNIRPFKLTEVSERSPLKTFFLTGDFEGTSCFIKYSPVARKLTAAEFSFPQRAAKRRPDLFEHPLFWHTTQDGGAFVMIERIEGRPLSELLEKRDPILTERTEQLTRDMKEIALELEAAGLVHRDVRPSNLLVTGDGHVKLIDFQFATEARDCQEDPVTDAYPRILFVLGDRFALGRGQWNDRHSMRECLRLLPETEARLSALEALTAEGCEAPDRVACCSPSRMKWARRRLARLRRRAWLAKFFPRKRKRLDAEFKKEFETLESMVAFWHVVG